MRDAKNSLSIPLNEEKALVGARSFAALGAYFDGNLSVLGVHRRKRQLVAIAIVVAIFSSVFSYGEMASAVGVLNHCLLYNRALFSVLSDTFKWLSHFRGGTWLPRRVVLELLTAVIFLPFAENDLRKDFSLHVRASDSSMHGAAFGAAPASREQLEYLLRRCDARGTSVRVTKPIDSKSLSSVPSLLCLPLGKTEPDLLFKLILQWKWRYGNDVPIVLLEALAYFSMVKYLTKREENHDQRHFHIFDALGASGAFAKGRSSSLRMNRICRKVTALGVFANMTFYYAYTDSESQPMDEGSRVFPASSGNIPRDFTPQPQA